MNYISPQTSSDDPPFLNVGTEVSAKYRGAFCEATIKIAKKLVKCKVRPNSLLANSCLTYPLYSCCKCDESIAV